MEHSCTSCGRALRVEEADHVNGFARCEHCGTVNPVADRLVTPDPLVRVPERCSVVEKDGEIRLRAAFWSSEIGVYLSVFCLLWNAFVWGGAIETGMTTFTLFLLPFMAIGLFVLCICLLVIAGHVEIRLRGGEGTVRTGVWNWERVRPFKAASGTPIVARVTPSMVQLKRGPMNAVVVQAQTTVSVGVGLPNDRVRWLSDALNTVIGRRDPEGSADSVCSTGRSTDPKCPVCDTALTLKLPDLNEGAALCRNCGTLAYLKQEHQNQTRSKLMKPMPVGCSVIERDGCVQLRVSARNPFIAFACGFACAITGIVAGFPLIGKLHQLLIGPLPAWYPYQGFRVRRIPESETLNSPWEWAILIPVAAIFLWALYLLVFFLIGYWEVWLKGDEGSVNSAIGSSIKRRPFKASRVKRVFIDNPAADLGDSPEAGALRIDASTTIRFGMIPAERREWLCMALNAVLGLKPHVRAKVKVLLPRQL